MTRPSDGDQRLIELGVTKNVRIFEEIIPDMTITAIANRMGGDIILGRAIRNESDLMQLIEQGVPKATIRYLADSLGIDPKELIQYLPVTPRNLQRYQDSDRLSDTVSDHIVALAELFEHGEDALGKDYFRDWLHGDILALGKPEAR